MVARLRPARPPLPEGWHGALCSRPQTGLFNISSCRAFTESHLTLSLKERGARCHAGHLQQFTINLRRIKHPARSVLFLTQVTKGLILKTPLIMKSMIKTSSLSRNEHRVFRKQNTLVLATNAPAAILCFISLPLQMK